MNQGRKSPPRLLRDSQSNPIRERDRGFQSLIPRLGIRRSSFGDRTPGEAGRECGREDARPVADAEDLGLGAELVDDLAAGAQGRSARGGRVDDDGPDSSAAARSGHRLEHGARSAQMVRPYEAFSTLQPVKISPPSVSTAAPTRKRL